MLGLELCDVCGWIISLVVHLSAGLGFHDSVGQVELLNVLHDRVDKLVIDRRACVAAPEVILVQPLAPELYRVLQAFLWALCAKDCCIWDLKSLLESLAHELSDPLCELLFVL